MLNVVTLNLLNDLRHWHQRGPLIVDELRALQPDLIALQEVVLPVNTAEWLARRLDGYDVHLCPKTGRLRHEEALAILSRLPVEAHDWLSLVHQNRVAHLVVARQGDRPWIFANTHLYWHLLDTQHRLEQAQWLLDWLREHHTAMVCGDFNAVPGARSLRLLQTRFQSAHVAVHGREPEYTCPTPLHRGPGLRHRAREMAFRVGGPLVKRRLAQWRETIDYIFVEKSLRVLECRTAFTQPAPADPLIYPSDHLGLAAVVA